MRILVISTTVFPLPPVGYAGTEMLAYEIAVKLAERHHQVTVVAPKESKLPEGIELIPTELRESEEAAWARYRDRVAKGDFDIIHDHSFEGWVYMGAIGVWPELPIIHTLHTVPGIWGKPPPVPHPCIIGISEHHARQIRLQWGIDARRVYDGVDLEFYQRNPAVARNGRYLFVGRYTAEKGVLQAIGMAKRLGLSLDIFGDMEIIGSREYLDRCRNEADGLQIRAIGGIPRPVTVEQYSGAKGFLFPLQWDEPFGLTVMEASACGLPVLTLKRGSMSELIEPGVNGYIFDTEEELVQALKEDILIKQPVTDPRSVAQRFSLDIMVDNYEKMYQEMLAGQRW